MKNQLIDTPEISFEGVSVLDSMFYRSLNKLENETLGTLPFSKQNGIMLIKGAVKDFALRESPYSMTEVRLLEKGSDDIENAVLKVGVKNFKDLIEGKEPKCFLLVIDQTWTRIDIYQKSDQFLMAKIGYFEITKNKIERKR